MDKYLYDPYNVEEWYVECTSVKKSADFIVYQYCILK